MREAIKILQASAQVVTDLKERKWGGSPKKQTLSFCCRTLECFRNSKSVKGGGTEKTENGGLLKTLTRSSQTPGSSSETHRPVPAPPVMEAETWKFTLLRVEAESLGIWDTGPAGQGVEVEGSSSCKQGSKVRPEY